MRLFSIQLLAFATAGYSQLVIDRFQNSESNQLGNWHGKSQSELIRAHK